MGLVKIAGMLVGALVLTPLALSVWFGAGLVRFFRTLRDLFKRNIDSPLRSTEIAAEDLSAAAPLIIAVHGTFAPGAPWTHPDSALCRYLAQTLRPAPLFHRIEWSGANSIAARMPPLAELTSSLARIFQHNPDRRVIVIGHSHGGNIALKAAEEFADRPGLSIITLATPFLTAQLRPYPQLFQLAPVFALMPPFMAIGLLGNMFPRYFLLAMSVNVCLAALELSSFLRRPRAPQSDSADLMASLPDPGRVQALIGKSLIVSRTGDEADGVLKLAGLANGWIAAAIRQAAIFQFFGAVLEKASALAAGRKQGEKITVSRWWRELKPLLRGVFQLQGSNQEYLAIFAGIALLRVLRIAFGAGSGLAAIHTVITSSETPPGRWNHVQTLSSPDDDATLLSHSQIYDDPLVLTEMGRWILARGGNTV